METRTFLYTRIGFTELDLSCYTSFSKEILLEMKLHLHRNQPAHRTSLWRWWLVEEIPGSSWASKIFPTRSHLNRWYSVVFSLGPTAPDSLTAAYPGPWSQLPSCFRPTTDGLYADQVFPLCYLQSSTLLSNMSLSVVGYIQYFSRLYIRLLVALYSWYLYYFFFHSQARGPGGFVAHP